MFYSTSTYFVDECHEISLQYSTSEKYHMRLMAEKIRHTVYKLPSNTRNFHFTKSWRIHHLKTLSFFRSQIPLAQVSASPLEDDGSPLGRCAASCRAPKRLKNSDLLVSSCASSWNFETKKRHVLGKNQKTRSVKEPGHFANVHPIPTGATFELFFRPSTFLTLFFN